MRGGTTDSWKLSPEEDKLKIQVNRNALIAALATVSGVPEKKAITPSLSCVLLRAVEDVLYIGATDLTVCVESSCALLENAKPGEWAIPAKELIDRVKSMPDGPLTLSFDDKTSRVTLTAKGSPRKHTLSYLDGQDFPKLQQRDYDWTGASTINSGQLRKLITSTQHAMLADASRPYLSSALLQWDDTVVRMYATSGHALAKCELIGVPTLVARECFIPGKGIAEIRRALEAVGETETIVELSGTNNDIYLRANGWTMACRLTQATPPPYEKVIPKHETEVVIPRLQLIDAARSVRLAASESSGALLFRLSEGKLKVEAESSDHGESVDELDVDYTGEHISVGFNAGFLLESLSTLDTEEVVMKLGGGLDPVVVVPNVGKPNVTLIIMPVRLA
jgi:DNA polymerase-3 subunit beta